MRQPLTGYGGRKWLCAIAVNLFLQSAGLSVSAQVVTLSNLDSTATVNLGSGGSLGMTNWFVGGVNNLAQQWFWYRVGSSGPEQPITAIGGLTFNQPDSRTLNATYFNGQYGVTINYLLTGSQVVNSYSSADISESITITNATTSPLSFHFFQYADLDLAGSATGDTVALGKNLRGLYNEADQSKSGSIDTAFTLTVVTNPANHGEAGLNNSTLARLSDGNTDNLNDNVGPLTGDSTWALQWDFTIPAASSVGIVQDKYLLNTPPDFPEPSPLSLVSLGLIGFALSKRRLSQAGH